MKATIILAILALSAIFLYSSSSSQELNDFTQQSLQASLPLKLMVLTYNQENTSGNHDTLKKIEQLMNVYQNKPDVIFVCQQETKGNDLGKSLLNEGFFSQVNYVQAKNSEFFMNGITGGKINYLGSTVLVLRNLQQIITVKQLKKVSVDMLEGKGGVWTQLSAYGYNYALGCAHLDSSSAQNRESNVQAMIKGVVGNSQSNSGAEKLLSAGTNIQDVKQIFSAYLITGDLNFRTAPVASINNRHQMISQFLKPNGYIPLFEQDTLKSSSLLTGFKFTCNDPFDRFDGVSKGYGPTYKRQQVQACEQYAKSHDLENACQCFYGGSVAQSCPQTGKFSDKDLKKGDMQMGWLDRVCIKTSNNNAQRVIVTKTLDVACETCYESDHIPVVQQYTFTPTTVK